MPTQIEPAKLALINSLDASFFGKKVRVVGRLLAYDALNGLVLLLDGEGKNTVVVDVREALDESSSEWANERLGSVIVMGYVEESPEELPVFETTPFVRGILQPVSSMVIRAILVLPAGDLDLRSWSAVVEAEKTV